MEDNQDPQAKQVGQTPANKGPIENQRPITNYETKYGLTP